MKKEKKGGENMDGGGDKGGEKKVGGPISVVLQLDIHCVGYARKIKKSVKNFEGVESVSTDMANNELTVINRVDPWKILDRVESKTRRKVDLISLAKAPKKDSAPKATFEPKKAQPDSKDQKKPNDKMPKPPAVSTVVSKIRLPCIHRLRKTILKSKAVETVNVESQKDLVTVQGTMDVNTLPSYLKDKLKGTVEVVPHETEGGSGGGGGGGGGDKMEEGGVGGGGKKEKGGEKGGDGGGGGDKMEKGGDGGGEKKEKGGEKGGDGGGDEEGKEGGGERKEEGKKDESGEKQATAASVAPVAVEANEIEYYVPYDAYRVEMLRAPQLFSDENPNPCSIM